MFLILGFFMKNLYALAIGALVSCNMHAMWMLKSAYNLATSYIQSKPEANTHFNELPSAVVAHIATFLPKHAARDLRLVNRLCSTIPSPEGLCACGEKICEIKQLIKYVTSLNKGVSCSWDTDKNRLRTVLGKIMLLEPKEKVEYLQQCKSMSKTGSFAEIFFTDCLNLVTSQHNLSNSTL